MFLNGKPLYDNWGFREFKITKELLNKTCTEVFNKDTVVQDKQEPIISLNQIFYNNFPFSIALKRTIRIPDDDKINNLPPDLGNFPLEKDKDEKDKKDKDTEKVKNKKVKSIMVPMYQREALWINFSNMPADRQIAVKVGVGDLDAITGQKWVDGLITRYPQNYILPPNQRWLDGIYQKSEPSLYSQINSVRQFVAMPIDDSSTIEAQLLKQGKISEIKGV